MRERSGNRYDECCYDFLERLSLLLENIVPSLGIYNVLNSCGILGLCLSLRFANTAQIPELHSSSLYFRLRLWSAILSSWAIQAMATLSLMLHMQDISERC